mmetsp:Transcript_16406/g.35189  ORF Transcript_16406/g.35189 Transcript_16406/m.35189 type:complete len:514 (-) Transcript_16406:184-1725(-)
MDTLRQLQRVNAVTKLLLAESDSHIKAGLLRQSDAIRAQSVQQDAAKQARAFVNMLSAGCNATDLVQCLLQDGPREDGAGLSGFIDLGEIPLNSVKRIFEAGRPHEADINCGKPDEPPPAQTSPCEPSISLNALKRARTTLDDFSDFYFPIHGLPKTAFFRHLPLLVFVEASIYQLDEENEQIARIVASTAPACSGGSASSSPQPCKRSVLRRVLESHGLLSEKVANELQAGESYWQLERTLCAAMAAGQPISKADVLRASSLKSFDYRVLHDLLRQRYKTHLDTTTSARLDAFLRVDECLTDICDDLYDYEKDVAANAFNVLRGLAHAVADAAPLELAAHISQLEAQHEALLRALPTRMQQAYRLSRRAAMRRPGTERWIFPPMMLPDEEARFRRERGLEAEAGAHSDSEDSSTDYASYSPAQAGSQAAAASSCKLTTTFQAAASSASPKSPLPRCVEQGPSRRQKCQTEIVTHSSVSKAPGKRALRLQKRIAQSQLLSAPKSGGKRTAEQH